jgi:hypothetical protein
VRGIFKFNGRKETLAMRRGGCILAVAFQLAGCASAELNSNTLDLASTTDDLLTQQVFYNLSNFIDSDRAYPAQAVVSSGTATTSDTLGEVSAIR